MMGRNRKFRIFRRMSAGLALRVFLLGLLQISLSPSAVKAQGGGKVEFEAHAPLRAAVGESFQIQFTVGIQGATEIDPNSVEFAAPQLSGVNVIAGPVPSYGMFSSTQNGVMQNRATITYTYLVQAPAAGSVRIPAAEVRVAGKSYRSKPLTVECENGSGGLRGSGGPGTTRRAAPTGSDRSGREAAVAGDDILLRMEVNKSEVYRGEPVVATLRLYTQVPVAGVEQAKYPALNGFWAQELDVSDDGGSRVTLGGKVYRSHTIRQWLLYPQRAGVVEIEQAQFTVMAQIVTEQPETGTVYDLWYGGASQVKNVPVKLRSPVVKVRVKDLPQPQPEGFTGAVGRFELTGGISGDRFSANSAGAITVRLSGTGNFPLIEAPGLELPVAFEQFDRKTNERLTNTPQGTTGEKTFEYPFIARAEGQYTLPGLRFAYFDPSSGEYRTLTVPDFPVEVLRDDSEGGTSGLGMVAGVTKEDLRLLDSDIRFIRMGDPGLVRRGGVFLWSWGWFLTLFLLSAAFVGLLLYLQKSLRARADVARVRTRKASRVALRRLKRAKTFMNAGTAGAFFEELLRALWGYMGDKLSIEVAELTKERVFGELTEVRGIAPEEAREFLGLLGDCEFAQYSPAAGIEPAEAYRRAAELIDRFESKL